MPSSFLSRLPGRFFFLAACIAPSITQAQLSEPAVASDTVALDRMVVSASRTLQDPHNVPSSVSVITPDQLAQEQVSDLRTALAEEPGVLILNTGAFGSVSSVLLRGSNSYQTLFIVDGVRMNDRSADYGNFLGAADLSNIGHIEVLRGPQSTLYGSSAMGGVILIDSVHGQGPAGGSVNATVGSFDSWGGSAAVSGSEAGLSYSAAVGHFSTDNDRADNDLRQWSYATRLEYRVTDNIEIGTTFRGEIAYDEEPGSTLFLSPGTVDAQNTLGTIFAQVRLGENFTSRLTLGFHHRLYAFLDDFGVSDLHNTREILDWQNTWEVSQKFEVVAGTNFEGSRYIVDGVKTTDRLGAGYVSTMARPIKNLTFTAGLRYDDYKSAGDAVTWRLGTAWQPVEGTKIRATYGTGFSAPGSDDRYGVAEFGELPNPDLKPEKSRGWDVGVDQDILGGKGTLSATYFHNRFRNLFDFEYVDFATFQGRIVNLAQATTEGFELSASARLGLQLQVRGAYTYLEANDDTAGTRLTRRPRHVADGEANFQATAAWNFGVGLHLVADRIDGFGPMPDYTTARLFTGYALKKNVQLKLHVENALDKHYEEVRGYPALPFGIFSSVEWRF